MVDSEGFRIFAGDIEESWIKRDGRLISTGSSSLSNCESVLDLFSSD
jgi:hypothetical protein